MAKQTSLKWPFPHKPWGPEDMEGIKRTMLKCLQKSNEEFESQRQEGQKRQALREQLPSQRDLSWGERFMKAGMEGLRLSNEAFEKRSKELKEAARKYDEQHKQKPDELEGGQEWQSALRHLEEQWPKRLEELLKIGKLAGLS